MKRIGLLALAVAAVCAISGATASVSTAIVCVRVDEPGSGHWTNPGCSETQAGQPRNWVQIKAIASAQPQHQWCVEVEVPPGEAVYSDAFCTSMVGQLKYHKIILHPDWWVGGNQLKQGAQQIKLQLKGPAVLESKIAAVALTIECKNGSSEGSTIEGQGFKQGQDKGRITFTQCATKAPKCKVAEPITTVQTKSRLGMIAGQNKYADLFEPQQGTTFAIIKIIDGAEPCAVKGEFPVKGSVAAEVIPGEAEGQEGMLNFPTTAISKVLLDNETKEGVGLSLGVEPAKFGAAFGARLATNQPYGVFGLD